MILNNPFHVVTGIPLNSNFIVNSIVETDTIISFQPDFTVMTNKQLTHEIFLMDRTVSGRTFINASSCAFVVDRPVDSLSVPLICSDGIPQAVKTADGAIRCPEEHELPVETAKPVVSRATRRVLLEYRFQTQMRRRRDRGCQQVKGLPSIVL